MKFSALPLLGAHLIEAELREDERGAFARTFCAREFAAQGLETTVAQCNLSMNRRRGTLRGMHFVVRPAAEAKLVRCTRGAIHDVIVDLRTDSATFLQHVSVQLSAKTHAALYIPPRFAHGFQTLEDDTEVFYQISDFYAPGHERGIRHDDPALGIEWPLPVTAINDRDRAWPLLGDSPATMVTS